MLPPVATKVSRDAALATMQGRSMSAAAQRFAVVLAQTLNASVTPAS